MLHWQEPFWQTFGLAQTMLQLPQWLASVSKFTQVLPHKVMPAPHWQLPDTQLAPVGHLFPHEPQWFTSLASAASQPSPSEPLQSA